MGQSDTRERGWCELRAVPISASEAGGGVVGGTRDGLCVSLSVSHPVGDASLQLGLESPGSGRKGF